MEHSFPYFGDSRNHSVNMTSDSQSMSSFGYRSSAIYLLFITIAGITLNGLVLVIIGKDKKLQTPLNLILVNLSTSDLCIAAFGGSLSIDASLHQGWNMNFEMCVAYAFGMSLAGIVSITTLSVLALWRSLCVVHSFGKRELGFQECVCFIILIWVYSIAITGPPLFGWGQYEIEASRISCSIKWEVQDWNNKSYIIYLFVGGLFLPLIIMAASYICIIRTVKKSRRLVIGEARRKGQRRVTLMVAIMILAFLIAWMPYAVFSLIQTVTSDENLRFTPAVATIPSLFAKSSIVFNPLIYCGLNTQFHSSFKRLLGFQKHPLQKQEDVERTKKYVTRGMTLTGFSLSLNKRSNKGTSKVHQICENQEPPPGGRLEPDSEMRKVAGQSPGTESKEMVFCENA